MSVIGTIEIPAEKFALGAALAADPDVRIRLERVVPLGSTFVPYIWVSNPDVEAVEAALRSASPIEAVEVVDRLEDEGLVRVEWAGEVDGLLTAIDENGATILEAIGEADGWTMQLRFDDHTDLSAFYRQCVDEGITLDLESVYNPGHPGSVGLRSDLTDAQYDALVTALEGGYFEVPRRRNLTELAAGMGVSDTAASQRLRRGISSLLAATLSESEDGPASDE